MEAPEKAILSSYIIKYLNRDSSAKVDRLLKGDYSESKNSPLIMDMKLRCQLMAFFSETGCGEISTELLKYYREKELYSSLLDAKNMLVISSKENIVNSDVPLDQRLSAIARMLIEKGQQKILKGHIKSVLASCTLMGRLGENFEKLMSGELMGKGLGDSLIEFLATTCKESKGEIKHMIETSIPSENRNIE